MELLTENTGVTLAESPHFLMRISQRIFNKPLLIEESELGVVLSVLGPRIGGAFVAPEARVRSTRVDRKTNSESRTQSTAVIPIVGPLVHRQSGSALSGGPTTYNEIRAELRKAMDDPDVSSILFDIDSGGGEVSGAFDLADEIHQAREKKPVYAYVNEAAFSAAYLLASAAKKVWMPRTGSVGSIGVIALHRDESAKDMAEGIKYTPIFAGDAKYDFTQHGPLNDRAKETIQGQVNEIYSLFVDTVARSRGMEQESVRDTRARIFQGQDAIKRGLVDEILTFEEALERTFSRKGSMQMATENKENPVTMEQMAARLAALEAENDQLKQTAESSAKSDTRFAILNACLAVSQLLGGAEGARTLADSLIKEGVSMDVAHERILKAVSERQSKEEIRSSVGADTYGDVNPLDAACDALISQLKRQ